MRRHGHSTVCRRDHTDPQGRVALVRHVKPDVYDFWVAPGGGVDDGEDLRTAAAREVFEEAGLRVMPERLIAIEQLMGNKTGHHVKHWFFARLDMSPPMSADTMSTDRELIAEGRWFSRAEMAGLTIFPPFLRDEFWIDLAEDFPDLRILDLRIMQPE